MGRREPLGQNRRGAAGGSHPGGPAQPSFASEALKDIAYTIAHRFTHVILKKADPVVSQPSR
jgi:hypothetical protein